MELKRPHSSQTTVEVNFDEPDAISPHPRIQFGVAECIETKTVTTTTTTKRSYPPLLVREARPLLSLDAKEFPLARKPTPPELAHVLFSIHDPDASAWRADQDDLHHHHGSQQSAGDDSTQGVKAAGALDDSFTESQSSCSKPPSPSFQAFSRKALRMSSRSGSAAMSNITKKNRNRFSIRPQSESFSHAVADRLRRGLSRTARLELTNDSDAAGGLTAGFPVTPDVTDLPPSLVKQPLKLHRSNLDSFETPQSEPTQQQQSFFDISSPTGSDSHTAFSNVATPPITDADMEAEPLVDADESLQRSIRALHHPRPINTIVAQDASLPSPRLSPTLQASQLHTATHEREARTEHEPPVMVGDRSQTRSPPEDEPSLSALSPENEPMAMTRYGGSQTNHATYMDSLSMLESFDAMPSEMQSFMMYQFLRRCSRKTLHIVADVVNPALKCDILQHLPLELTLHVLSFLDHRDLCRAAQVSKYWRGIIDSNETGWKELFDRDGFVLASGELDRAIREGWGWQDPVGPEGCEQDFSLQKRLTSTETELHSKPDLPLPKLRSSKRKRALNSFNSDRSKRRASNQDNVKDDRTYTGSKVHKSEGPISAANAAAVAVPDPQIGIASLRRLHLFKSLYRRHYMIRKSWTSGKVKPGHVAFAAHPRHVITCLQFDDDKIITGSDDMLIHVYDTKTGKLRRRLEGHEGGVWALQYEGNVLVSGSTDRSVRVWDIEKGLCTQVFYGHTSTVRCLQILMPTKTVKDGQETMMPAKPLIITGSRDSQLRVWRLPEAGSRRYIQTGPPANDADCPYFIRTLQGHTHSVRAIAAHADTLVSGSYDNTVRVWRISTGQTVHVLQGHSQKVYSVVLDVKRNRCISGSMDSLVKIWDLETGSCLHTLEGHSLLVGLLDIRDERLVSAAADSTLRIWDPETGRCQSTLTAHTGAITCFQHDGRKVISGSDRNLKMWDTRTGECLQDLLKDLSGVWQVRFDERRCVAAVQRDNLTYVEILDFGAIRDGKKPEELGKRLLLNPSEVQRIIEEDA